MDELTRTALYRRIEELEVGAREAREHASRIIDRLTEERDAALRVAETDSLTNIGNRLYFDRRTQVRQPNEIGWFIVIDVNDLKPVNDNIGHHAGDQLIRDAGAFIHTICRTKRGRSEDRVYARVGGDEFYVWCPTRHGARRIKELVRTWVHPEFGNMMSAGMGRDLATADANMYEYKKKIKGLRKAI